MDSGCYLFLESRVKFLVMYTTTYGGKANIVTIRVSWYMTPHILLQAYQCSGGT